MAGGGAARRRRRPVPARAGPARPDRAYRGGLRRTSRQPGHPARRGPEGRDRHRGRPACRRHRLRELARLAGPATARRTGRRGLPHHRRHGRGRAGPRGVRRPDPGEAVDRVVGDRARGTGRRGRRRAPGRGGPRRPPAARPHRRAVRLGQNQLHLCLARRADRPLLPRRAGAVPAGLQGGRILRPLRAGPPRSHLAATRPAGRHQRQHRSGVRPRAVALPGYGAAAASRSRQASGSDEARRAARRGSERALAAHRGRGRRVPGAARRARRASDRGGHAAGGPRPARSLARHPPRPGQPRRLRHRGAVGPLRAGRPVLVTDRTSPSSARPSTWRPARRG